MNRVVCGADCLKGATVSRLRDLYSGWQMRIACWQVRRQLRLLGFDADMTDEEMVEGIERVAKVSAMCGVSAHEAAAAIGRLVAALNREGGDGD